MLSLLAWPLNILLFFLSFSPAAQAASPSDWRGRSIYQVIIDRYALANGSDLNACDPSKQTWCGGTWNTLRENLDYIQDAGFTAVWISPVQQNWLGQRTPYGDPYHGYWIQDSTQLNLKFGTADDLKALSAEIHKRNMYLMVDVVVNDVMALSTTPDYSIYMFKDASFYHPYCPVDFSNTTSEQLCWLGDLNVTLPDLDTKNPDVISGYNSWIKELVSTYSIDGLRIDAAKHVDPDFWPSFCGTNGAAGVFCMGEVFGGLDVEDAAEWQGPLDSVLNYPMYTALTQAFQIPGPLNISAVTDTLAQSKSLYKDTTVLGNFLENQDLPRWAAGSVDVQSLFNAMTFNFMSDGIPIVYYGQEQYFRGAGDPLNREPLWPSNYEKTPAYQFIQQLNQFRNYLISVTANTSTPWTTAATQVLTTSQYGIAIMKGDVISILTNIGSPAQNNTHIAVATPYERNTALTNVLTCEQWVVGSQGFVEVEYTEGGHAVILYPSTSLVSNKSPVCSGKVITSQSTTVSTGSSNAASSVLKGNPRTALWTLDLLMIIGFTIAGGQWWS
ncbi:glycoside hydrolase family 13 protein [Collybiopsis luxurians FD-317 M1]|uniref:alpha-amylase n=1 Tax=Collybiopsis luxurians FD-317 M1 TaxID=944289 RepID=A0A0D0CLC2_9AGAR|nr:glycoside hydrolase family 13 protein [Collybiopsis luxurians FD-317 M1]